MLKLLFLKKIRKLNLVLTQMIVIHQSLLLKRLLLKLLQNKLFNQKKLLLKRNHLQKNLMTLMIQMIVKVPKMLSQLEKFRQNQQQKLKPKKLNHLLDQMIPMIQAQMMILDQMMMKTKAKRVKSQQKNNKRQLKRQKKQKEDKNYSFRVFHSIQLNKV